MGLPGKFWKCYVVVGLFLARCSNVAERGEAQYSLSFCVFSQILQLFVSLVHHECVMKPVPLGTRLRRAVSCLAVCNNPPAALPCETGNNEVLLPQVTDHPTGSTQSDFLEQLRGALSSPSSLFLHDIHENQSYDHKPVGQFYELR